MKDLGSSFLQPEMWLELEEWAKTLGRRTLLIGPDDYAPNTWSAYSPAPLNRALYAATERMQEHVGKTLNPVCSFVRRYENGAHLRKHIDRPEIEWTVSLALHNDGADWPIHIQGQSLSGKAIALRSGAVPHWREPLGGNFYTVGLLHWAGPSHRVDPPSFVVVKGLLEKIDLALIYRREPSLAWAPGMIGVGGVASDNRSNSLAWLKRPDDWQWLYDKIRAGASRINDIYWKLDMGGETVDEIQMTRYKTGESYGWHRDVDEKAKGSVRYRTVSAVVLLNKPSSGGGIEFADGGVADLDEGDAVIFPSGQNHRALEVTAGRRDTLVVWFARSNPDVR